MNDAPVIVNRPIDKITNNPIAIYLPGLNGLRSIAALAVVIAHTTMSLDDIGLSSKIFGTRINGNWRGLDLATSGVSIFFTLSGFLITFLLLKEKEISQIKVKDFYIRRLLRIWPLYYLYFAISAVTAIYFGVPYKYELIPFYIFLTANIPFILGTMLPFVAHYWSLGVEEQFYLFFPHLAKLPNDKLLKTSFIIIVIFLIIKGFFWVLSKKYNITQPLSILTVCRFDVMLIGVIGAILYYKANDAFLNLSTHKITQLVSWGCILLLAMNKTNFLSVIHEEIVGVITVFLIMGQITRKNYIINLDNRFCNFIGRISYGIYVVHPLLIFCFCKIIGSYNSPSISNYLFTYFIIIAATILIAKISYEFYEKPFIKLKSKYTIIKSSS